MRALPNQRGVHVAGQGNTGSNDTQREQQNSPFKGDFFHVKLSMLGVSWSRKNNQCARRLNLWTGNLPECVQFTYQPK